MGKAISIELFDVLGRLLDSKIQNTGTSTSLDISHVAKGTYLLRIKAQAGEGIATYKIQKL